MIERNLILRFVSSILSDLEYIKIFKSFGQQSIKSIPKFNYNQTPKEINHSGYIIRFGNKSPESFSQWFIYFLGVLKERNMIEKESYSQLIEKDFGLLNQKFDSNESLGFDFEGCKIKLQMIP